MQCGKSKADIVEDEDDDEQDEWKEDDDEDTDGESRGAYRKNKWKLVAVWTNIDKQKALRRAAEIMIDDFQIVVDQYNRQKDWTIWTQKCEYYFGLLFTNVFLIKNSDGFVCSCIGV